MKARIANFLARCAYWLLRTADYLHPSGGVCDKCGCSDFDACVTDTGGACYWVAPGLCSACSHAP